MTSARRVRAVARPRQIAMYLSRELTKQSFGEIGRRFGCRDHTTVLHACRQIDRLRATLPEVENDIQQITARLRARRW
jgi:chromosomal replication initiator protein